MVPMDTALLLDLVHRNVDSTQQRVHPEYATSDIWDLVRSRPELVRREHTDLPADWLSCRAPSEQSTTAAIVLTITVTNISAAFPTVYMPTCAGNGRDHAFQAAGNQDMKVSGLRGSRRHIRRIPSRVYTQ
ncbi:uncharacterized protein BP5553_05526 [Venustampulla echinocandica]|uniref:Uncharacterized protein n=1 Tax=Venustampulla echinocandica TaxID=2656787 RepID=A0A370TRG2_9HELO|nr:uncharacterized protein BP5553_05526 [Venustampulla echinocandica]RDL38093.1 hypothetical protein BP5553_05526 [Venustampulla echinocandica]